ncbi:hypothetical protein [Actinokineospora enzanensis]|uniref:hypothetical protein n=1 Tax=Actinokineospora enzanensis TaxID=155975 RepID=UPI0003755331|nr:hypothetical protein [Actinokineospora enzanensis]
MSKQRKRWCAAAAVVVVGGSALGGPAVAKPVEVAGPVPVVDLGTLPGGANSLAEDVDDNGTVVGESDDAAGISHAVRWDRHGRITDLGAIDGTGTKALAVNGRGTATGFHGTAGQPHAVRWAADGTLCRLPELTPPDKGGFSVPTAIDDTDTVIGYASAPDTGTHAVRWDARGRITDLGTLPGGWEAVPYAMYGGVAVGFSTGADRRPRAVRWDRAGRITELDGLPGQQSSYALGISADGTAFGWSVLNADTSRAVRWDRAGRVAELPSTPDAAYTEVTHVSANGIAVGPMVGPGRTRVARWRHERLEVLGVLSAEEDMVPSDVNGDGVVVGQSNRQAGGQRAVRWDRAGQATALPEPPDTISGAAVAVNAPGMAVGWRLTAGNRTRATAWP